MAHTQLNPLLRWARTRQRALEQPDFGDHGTAFGMELSMAPASPGPEPGSGHETPAAAAVPPPAEIVGRWRRLSGRRPWRDG